mmetsp:Transcript_84155/g.260215  ORF Transcript_84155/g.260215 Transcript_84155/m.260215 type:complete len:292 (+) Transcript_84155:462-1337(+)
MCTAPPLAPTPCSPASPSPRLPARGPHAAGALARRGCPRARPRRRRCSAPPPPQGGHPRSGAAAALSASLRRPPRRLRSARRPSRGTTCGEAPVSCPTCRSWSRAVRAPLRRVAEPQQVRSSPMAARRRRPLRSTRRRSSRQQPRWPPPLWPPPQSWRLRRRPRRRTRLGPSTRKQTRGPCGRRRSLTASRAARHQHPWRAGLGPSRRAPRRRRRRWTCQRSVSSTKRLRTWPSSGSATATTSSPASPRCLGRQPQLGMQSWPRTRPQPRRTMRCRRPRREPRTASRTKAS